jgi:hypothetical protein
MSFDFGDDWGRDGLVLSGTARHYSPRVQKREQITGFGSCSASTIRRMRRPSQNDLAEKCLNFRGAGLDPQQTSITVLENSARHLRR